MTAQNIGLLKALGAKMHYLDQRQRVIAQNVANADTPGYQPHDLVPIDFRSVLKEASGGVAVRPVTTHAGHMPSPGKIQEPKDKEQRETYEVAPEGNAVILEEQMIKAAKTTMDYNLMTSLMQKNVGMLKMAIGRGQ